MVHRIGIPARKPTISKTIPRMIMRRSLPSTRVHAPYPLFISDKQHDLHLAAAARLRDYDCPLAQNRTWTLRSGNRVGACQRTKRTARMQVRNSPRASATSNRPPRGKLRQSGVEWARSKLSSGQLMNLDRLACQSRCARPRLHSNSAGHGDRSAVQRCEQFLSPARFRPLLALSV